MEDHQFLRFVIGWIIQLAMAPHGSCSWQITTGVELDIFESPVSVIFVEPSHAHPMKIIQYAFLSHRATPPVYPQSSSISRWAFPWLKPSSCGVPPFMETPLFKWVFLVLIFKYLISCEASTQGRPINLLSDRDCLSLQKIYTKTI